MRIVGIDTNILLRLIVDDDEGQRRLVTRFGDGLGRDYRGFVTVVSLVEVDWALRRQYGYARRESMTAIRRLTGIRGVEIEQHDVVVRAIHAVETGNADFADALIAGSARERGCDVVFTFDRGAAKAIANMELLA